MTALNAERTAMLDAGGLASRLQGELISPSDPPYDEVRAVWNAMIDRRPAAIVRARDDRDVMQAVSFAREKELPIAVRGGGHNIAGTSATAA